MLHEYRPQSEQKIITPFVHLLTFVWCREPSMRGLQISMTSPQDCGSPCGASTCTMATTLRVQLPRAIRKRR